MALMTLLLCHRSYLVAIAVCGLLSAQASADESRRAPLPESKSGSIGFESVYAAKTAVVAQEGVEIEVINEWTIDRDDANYTIWSFAPESYPAYPAVVKRFVTPIPGGSKFEMRVRCEDDKDVCDDLVCTFAEMNRLPQEGC